MIQIQMPTTKFQPSQSINATVRWQDLTQVAQIDVRLIWYTQGKGTQDYHVVDSKPIDTPGSTGARDIQFTAPNWPVSFSGELISLLWAIEAVELPSEQAERCDLVIGANGQELVLPQSADVVD